VGVAFSPVTTAAFLWENGVATNLGTLPGDFSSRANWINSKGQVIGGILRYRLQLPVFLWQNAVMTDLTTLMTHPDLFLLVAVTLNDRGQSVVWIHRRVSRCFGNPTNAAADHGATPNCCKRVGLEQIATLTSQESAATICAQFCVHWSFVRACPGRARTSR
jgi:probable HAF family extracellular repeat protein